MYEGRSKHYIAIETFIRIMLGAIFVVTEYAEPFHRKIQPEEVWLYKNPRRPSYVPTYLLWPIISVMPLSIIYLLNFALKNKGDGLQALLGLTLTFGINGVITNTVKLVVGRPRPDFFYRCFPSGEGDITLPCNGDKDEIIEGLKSFPSGHSSFVFASMMYCTLYMCGKLHVFTVRGRGESWRLMVSICPIFFALLVALSRTCDYHHHWQDVLSGSMLGIIISWICYFQYYPLLSQSNCGLPLSAQPNEVTNAEQMKKSDNLEHVTVKWI